MIIIHKGGICGTEEISECSRNQTIMMLINQTIRRFYAFKIFFIHFFLRPALIEEAGGKLNNLAKGFHLLVLKNKVKNG